jgi:predicted DNA-binding transcriptional regulator AlpA
MTNDNLTLFIFLDLITRRIVPNRPTLQRWMQREEDPFPRPIVLAEGKQWTWNGVPKAKQSKNGNGSEPETAVHVVPRQRRFSGRRVAWRASDVEAWLERRAKASNGTAA